jgi:hypothetical protein
LSEYVDLNVFSDVVVEVYRDGRIKTKDHCNRVKINGSADNRKGKFLSPGIDKYGYEKVVLTRLGVRKNYPVHRLVALAWIPNLENKDTVNHKNGVKSDNRVENLEWATHEEQKRHAIRFGLTTENIKALKIANEKRARQVEFSGIVYQSIREAAREENVSRTLIKSKGVFI